jgi:hypothetical protein
MPRQEIVSWLVGFAASDAERLKQGRPGDLPNLVYDLRRWLDLEPDEPLNAEVVALERDAARVQRLAASVRELLEAVADRRRFEIRYRGGKRNPECRQAWRGGWTGAELPRCHLA